MNGTIRTLYVAGERRGGAEAGALESAGCDVVRAEGGLDGLRRLRSESVECVVCAGKVPGLPTEAFVRGVQSNDSAPPVVLFDDDPERAVRGLRAGAEAYVPDRLDGERELVERVREVVAEERTQEAIDRHRQLETLSFEALRGALAASTRSGSEAAVQCAFAESALYRSAWFGTYAPQAEALELNEPVEGVLSTGALDGGGGDPVRRSLADGDVARVTDQRGAIGIVPCADRDGTEGVLLVASTRESAFDRAECALLADLGDALARALRRSGGSTPPGTEDERRVAEELAHELRGLVGVVSTQLELARESGGATAIDRAERALDRIDHTVENVLAIAGEDSIGSPVEGNLADDAEAAWERVDAPASELRLENPPTIRADHDAVVRLLANLFRNAIEHGSPTQPVSRTAEESGSISGDRSLGDGGDVLPAMAGDERSERGGVDERDGGADTGVTVRVGPLSDGFYVEDDGPGMPAEVRDRAFEWGYSTAETGTGIGLAVVHEIVDAHGWDVRIRDGEDGGTRVEITDVDGVKVPFHWGDD